jgi:hypothetical protein
MIKIPKLQMSLLWSKLAPLMISGAVQCGPTKPFLHISPRKFADISQSKTLMLPSRPIKTLLGLSAFNTEELE